MSEANGDEELTPAERRLSEHLELLRSSPPTTAPDLIAGILRRARWQTAVRDPLIFVGVVSAAIIESLTLLSSSPAGEP